MLPDGTVLDGEILAFRDSMLLPFSTVQHRIGRQHLTAKIMAEAPVVFLSYDLLEANGADLRAHALSERRAFLTQLLTGRSRAYSKALREAWSISRTQARLRHIDSLQMVENVLAPKIVLAALHQAFFDQVHRSSKQRF